MIVNIVNSAEMLKKDVWSVNFLLPQEEIRVSEGYSLLKLSQLAEERRELITLSNDYGDVNYIGLENIESRTGRLIDFSAKHGNDIKSACKVFMNGDILYGRLRPNLNKVFYNDTFHRGECSTEILVLIPDTASVNPIYLAELLRSDEVNKRIVNMVKGAALPRVSITDLMQLQLPIPSLDEQRRMAEIILRKRAELEEHLKKAQQIPAQLSEMLSASFARPS